MAEKKSRKRCGCVIYSYFKNSAKQLKRLWNFETRYVKCLVTICQIQAYERGNFSFKNGALKDTKGLDLGAGRSLPVPLSQAAAKETIWSEIMPQPKHFS